MTSAARAALFALVCSALACGASSRQEASPLGSAEQALVTPTKLGFVVQPADGVAGVTLATIKVAVQDASGNTVTTAVNSVKLVLSGPGAPATLGGTSTVGASAGVATFSTLKVNKAAAFTLTATSGTLTSAVSVAFNVAPAAASKLSFSVQPTDTVPGVAISPAVQVTALDSFGNVATGSSPQVSIALGANPTAATLTGGAPVAALSGVASFASIKVDKAGTNYTLVASAAGLTAATSSAFSQPPAGYPWKLAIVSQPASTTAGATLSSVGVQIQDSRGTIVSTASSTISLALSGAGTLSGTTSAAASAGSASFANLSVARAGTYTITASSGSLLPATTVSFTISPAAASAVGFAVQPTNAVAGARLSPAVQASVRDAFGNLVTSSSASITVGLAANPGGATLSGTATVAAVSGVATFSTLSLDKVGVGYTLSAAAAGLAADTSAPFNISPAAASILTLVSGQGQAGAAGSALAAPLVVRVTDSFGNAIAGRAITWSATSGGGSVAPASSTTAADGSTQTAATLGTAAGANRYTATSAGLSGSPATFNATGNPGAASQLAFTVQPASRAAGTAFGVTVTLRDQFGNTAASSAAVSLALANNPGSGTLSGTTTVNAAAGVATFSGLSIDKLGTGYTLSASTPGATAAISSSFNITAAAASALVIASGENQSGSVGAQLAAPLVARVQDAFGNPVAGRAVSWAVAAGGGTVGATSTTSAADGTVQIAATLGTAAGANRYTATSGALTGSPLSFHATAAAGAAARLAFAQQPGNATAGAAISPAVRVVIQDSFGNQTSSAAPVALALAANPGGATLSGGASVAASAGAATFATLSLDKAAAGYTLTATSPGLTAATSTAFTIAAAAAQQLVLVSGDGQTATAGAALAQPLVVKAVDAFGNGVSGVTVAFSATAGGGSVSSASRVTTATGAQITATLGRTAGANSFQASAAGLTGSPVVFSATGVPGAASRLALVSGGGQTATVGTALAQPLVVRVTDSNGNGVAGTSVSWSVASGGGSIAPATTTSASDGTTSATASVGTAAGANSFRAASTGLAGSPAFSATGTAGPATQLAFTAQPSDVVAGASIAPAVRVTVQDQYANVVSAQVSSVTVALAANPGAATLSGTRTASTAAGVASFGNLSLDKAGAGYALSATSGALTSATSTSFAVSAAAAHVLASVSGGGQSGPAGAALPQPLVVRVTDRFGNPVQGTTVNWSGQGNGAPDAATSTSAADGTARVTAHLCTTVGSCGYQGAVAGLVGSPVTFTETTSAGVPASITAVGGANQSATVGATLAPFTVKLADAFGNPTPGIAVSWAVSSLNGSITPATSTTDGAGRASATATLGTTAGANGFSATAGSLTAGFTATGLPGAPTQVVFAVQPQDTTAGVAFSPAPAAAIEDAYGNVVTSSAAPVTVTLDQNPGSAALAGTTTVAAQGGVATFADLSLTRAATGYKLGAAAAGLTSAASSAFAIAPAAPSQLGFGPLAAQVTAGAPFSPQATVQVQDAFGNLVASASATVVVDLGTNPTGDALSGTLTRATVGGVASFADLALRLAGSGYTLTASDAANVLVPVASDSFDVLPAPAAALSFAQAPADGVAGATQTPPIAVELVDAFGNPAADASTISAAFAAAPPGASFLGTTSQPAAAGVATFGDLALPTAGSYQLAFTAAPQGFTVQSAAFAIAAGSPTSFAAVSGAGQTDVVGHALAQPLVVKAADAFGNPIAGLQVDWAPSVGTGSVSPASSITGSDGTASTLASLGPSAGYQEFRATIVNVAGTNLGETALAGPATTLVAVSGDGQSAAAGTTFAAPLRVLITDAYGNPAAGPISILWSADGALVDGAASEFTLSGADGSSQVTLTAGTTAGPAGVSVSAAGVSPALRFTATVLPGAAEALVFAPIAGGAAGQPISPAVQVRLADHFGNTAASSAQVSLALGANPAAGALSGTTSATAWSGIANFANLSIDNAGAGYTLVASSAGLPSASSQAFTVSPSCAAGTVACGASCVDPQSDAANCGSCGNACANGANATATCSAGSCGLSCAAGFADCDGNAANGCESASATDAANCGGCGIACSADQVCAASTCQAATVTISGTALDGYHGEATLQTAPSGTSVTLSWSDGAGGFTSKTAPIASDGSWSVSGVPAGEYTVGINGSNNFVVSSATSLDLGSDFPGRPDFVYGSPTTQLSLQADGLTPWLPMDQLQLVFPASWETSFLQNLPTWPGLTNGATTLSMGLDWGNSYGSPLLDTSKDYFRIVQLNGVRGPNGGSVASAIAVFDPAPVTPFVLADGSSGTLTGSFTPLAQDHSIALSVSSSSYLALRAQVNPSATAFNSQVTVSAIPPGHHQYSLGTLPSMVVARPPFQADVSFGTVSYADPYPASWARTANSQLLFGVDYRLPGTGAAFTGYLPNISHVPLAQVGSSYAGAARLGPPTSPTINGQDAFVSAAGVGLTPTLAWGAPTTGSVAPNYYLVTVQQLDVQAGQTVAGAGNFNFFTRGSSLTIPPGVLQPDASYYFAVVAEYDPEIDFAATPLRLGIDRAIGSTLSAAFRTTTPAACGAGQQQCVLGCSDPQADAANCGSCGAACPSGGNGTLAQCSAGSCGLACAAGTADCNGDPSDDCEVTLTSDVNNCGACGNACPGVANGSATCANSVCGLSCGAGFSLCGGACVAEQTDNDNCGACGNACGAGSQCTAGVCQPSCPAGQALCGATCVDTQNDTANCGACGNACPQGGPNVTASCSAGVCGESCAAGFADCDGNAANGCETTLATDHGNCGGCGVACGGNETCADSVCTPNAVACAPAPSGLVSWWTGDQTTGDFAGQNEGYLTGTATYGAGEAGSAFTFDGNGAFFAPAAGLPTGSDPRTVELWAYIAQDVPDTQQQTFFNYGQLGQLDGVYMLTALGSARTLAFTQWGANISGPSLPLRQWMHLAVTSSGNHVKMYLNGNLVAEGDLPIATTTGSQMVMGGIGAAPDGGFERLNGSVDELAVYSRELTAAELSAIAAAGSNGKCKVQSPGALQAISISPTAAALTVGQSRALAGVGAFSDFAQRDVTAQLTWSSDTPSVAAVSSAGVVTAAGPGRAVVTAHEAYTNLTTSMVVTVAAAGSPDVIGTELVTYQTDAAFQTRAPVDLTTNSLAAVVPATGQVIAAQGQADGSFTIPGVPNGPYWLKRQGGPNQGVVYNYTSARNLDLSNTVTAAQGARQPVTRPTQVQLDLDGLAAFNALPDGNADQVQVFIPGFDGYGYLDQGNDFGPLVQTGYPQPGDTAIHAQLDWGGLSEQGLFKSSRGDLAYIFQLSSTAFSPTTDVFSLERALAFTGPLELLDGTQTPPQQLAGTLTAPSQRHTVRVDFPQSQYAQLLQPLGTGGFTDGGIFLDRQPTPIAAGTTGASPDLLIFFANGQDDLSGSFSYGDPFPSDWSTFVFAQVNGYTRRLAPGATRPFFAQAQLVTAEPTQTALQGPLTPRLSPVTNLQIDGQDALAANATIQGGATLSWGAPALGADRHNKTQVTVWKLGINANGRTTRSTVATLITTGNSVTFPPGVLAPLQSYVFKVSAYAVAADPQVVLLRVPMPLAQADLISGVLTVAPPATATISQPAAGVTLLGGGSANIAWTVTNSEPIASQQLSLSLDNGATYAAVATPAPGDLAATIALPNSTSTQAIVKLTVTTQSGFVATALSGVFTIESCPAGQALCGATCTATAGDRNNCGACGNVCATGQACVSGSCTATCPDGSSPAQCGGTCPSYSSDVNNCGSCGRVCPATGANGAAGAACVNSGCVFTQCNPGMGDCDHNNGIGPGCETNLTSSVANCGACGHSCPSAANAAPTCSGSTCGFACAPGFADCDGVASNGCEASLDSAASCGACGVVCGAGQECVGRVCVSAPAGAGDVTGTVSTTYFADSNPVVVPTDLTTNNIAAIVPLADGTNTVLPAVGDATGHFVIHSVPAGASYWLRQAFPSGRQNFSFTSARDLDLGTVQTGLPGRKYNVGGPTNIQVDLTGLSAIVGLPDGTSDNLQMFSPQTDEYAYFNAGYDFGNYVVNHNYPNVGDTEVHELIDWSRIAEGGLFHSGDQLYFYQLTSIAPSPVLDLQVLNRAFTFTGPLDMVSGTQTPPQRISGALTSPALSRSINVDLRNSQFAALLPSIAPGARFGGGSFGYDRQPAPLAYGRTGGSPDLVLASISDQSDVSGTWGFFDPFPSDWTDWYDAGIDGSVPRRAPTARFSWVVGGGVHLEGPASDLASPVVPRISQVQNLKVNGLDGFAGGTSVGTSPTLSWDPPAIGAAQQTKTLVTVFRVYERNGGTANERVGTLTTTQSSLTFPPGALEPGQSYVFKVTSWAGSADASRVLARDPFPWAFADAISGVFTTSPPAGAPQVALTLPQPGAVYQLNTPVTIQWTGDTDASGTVQVFRMNDGFNFRPISGLLPGNTRSFTWSANPTGNLVLQVVAKTAAGVAAASQVANITVQAGPVQQGSATITAPAAGASVPGNQQTSIQWQVQSVEPVIGQQLNLSTDNGATFTALTAPPASATSVSIALPAVNKPQSQLQLIVTTASGRSFTATTSFSIALTTCPDGSDPNSCNGTCPDTSSDANNCGFCGNVCPASNPNGGASGAACQAYQCVFTQCAPGRGDCDHQNRAAPGCETDLTASVANCGACGNLCPSRPNAAPTCAASTCGIQCAPGFADCDGNQDNGCEASLNSAASCGACGHACGAGELCVNQACVTGPAGTSDVTATQIVTYQTDPAASTQVPTDFTTTTVAAIVPYNGGYSELPAVGDAAGNLTIRGVPAGGFWLRRQGANRQGTLYNYTSARALDLSYTTNGRADLVNTVVFDPTQVALDLDGLVPFNTNATDGSTDQVQIYGPSSTLYGFLEPADAPAGLILPGTEIQPGQTRLRETIDWAKLYNPSLYSSARGDSLWLYQLVATNPTPVLDVLALSRALAYGGPLEMMNGTQSPLQLIAGTLTAAPTLSASLDVRASQFLQHVPEMSNNPSFSYWSLAIDRAPTPLSAGRTGASPDLLILTGSDGTDVAQTFSYGDPFPAGWSSWFVMNASANTPRLMAGARNPWQFTNLIEVDDSSAALAAPVVPRISPVQNLKLNGADAMLGGANVGTTPTLTWDAPALGGALQTKTIVGAYRLYVRGNGSTRGELAAQLTTTQSSLTFPPGALQPGQAYLFRVTAWAGQDDATTVLARDQHGYADATSVSGVFTTSPAAGAPTVHIRYPQAGAIHQGGGLQLQWDASTDAGWQIVVYISDNNGTSFRPISSLLPGTQRSFTWGGFSPGTKIFKVMARNPAGLEGEDSVGNVVLTSAPVAAPTATWSSPAPGATLIQNTTATASWTVQDGEPIAALALSLTTDGGASFTALGPIAATDTSASFTVPAVVTANALLALDVTGASGLVTRQMSPAFAIQQPAPVTIVTPTAGVFAPGQVVSIQWQTAGITPAGARVFASVDGGADYQQISGPLDANATSFDWTASDVSSSQLMLLVEVQDAAGNTWYGSAGPLTLSGSAAKLAGPALQIFAPLAGAHWTGGVAGYIQWGCSDDSGMAAVDVAVSLDGRSYQSITQPQLQGSAFNIQYTPPRSPGQLSVRITCTANNGARSIGLSGAGVVDPYAAWLSKTDVFHSDVGDQPRALDFNASGNSAELLVWNGSQWSATPADYRQAGAIRMTNPPDGAWTYHLTANGRQIYLNTNAPVIDASEDIVGRLGIAASAAPLNVTLDLSGLSPWSNSGIGDLLGLAFPDSSRSHILTWEAGIRGADGQTAFTAPYDWASGIGALSDGTKDQVFGYHLATAISSAGVPYNHLAEVVPLNSVTVSDGSVVPMGMQPVAQDQSLGTLDWDIPSFANREDEVGPGARWFGNDIRVEAAGGGALIDEGNSDPMAFWIGYGNCGGGRTSPCNVHVTTSNLSYGNPFPASWPLSLQARADYQVPLALPGRTPWQAPAVISHRTDPVGQTVQLLMSPPAILQINALDGMQPAGVTNVGTSPTLSWAAPLIGAGQGYVVKFYELVDGGGQTYGNEVATLVTGASTIVVPPGILLDGHTYTARVSVINDLAHSPNQRPLRRGLRRARADAFYAPFSPGAAH